MSSVEVDIDVPEGYVVLDQIVLLKVLDPEGRVVFREHFGTTLNVMERYGMTQTAADTCEKMLTKGMRPD